mgnify:CR=1 FL=1
MFLRLGGDLVLVLLDVVGKALDHGPGLFLGLLGKAREDHLIGVDVVDELLALGADELLVANLPDLALTPRLAPAGALAHYASVTFNDALLDLLMKRPGTAR